MAATATESRESVILRYGAPLNEVALLPSRFRMNPSCREFAIAIFGKCRVLASSRAVSAVHSRSRTRRASLCSRGHLYDFLLNGESDQLRFVMDLSLRMRLNLWASTVFMLRP